MAKEPRSASGNECVQRFEEGQRLRKAGKLKAAAEALIACSQPVCPAFIAKECTNLYSEAQASLPSVTISVTDGQGQLLTAVGVYMDGELVTKNIDGRAIAVDPGVHEFRFEAEGKLPITTKVLISEGEKHKVVVAEFSAPVVTKPTLEPTPRPTLIPKRIVSEPKPRVVPEKSSPPMVAYVVGGLGIAAVGTGALLWLLADKDFDDAEDSCSPNCSDKRSDSIDLKYNLSYVGFGVGGAALITSGILFLAHGSDSEFDSTTGLSVFPLTAGNGIATTWRGRF